MFPALPSTIDPELDELRMRLVYEDAALGKGFSSEILQSISEFMLPVLSYYTNAMEGNPSKLQDIEKALEHSFSRDSTKRNYQKEHLAHIETHKRMLQRLHDEKDLQICSQDFLSWVHSEFYSRLPKEMHFATTVSGKKIPIQPGKLRQKGSTVGTHVAPESEVKIQKCLLDFHRNYEPSNLLPSLRPVALACAHHRLLWIHPFEDGNGRVARLFIQAYLWKIDMDRDCLWSVTRDFARHRQDYDRHLALADERRHHDYDGRGPLSEMTLVTFAKFFLKSCLEQIRYMASVLELSEFKKRYEAYLHLLRTQKKISASACQVLRKLLSLGEIKRGEVRSICQIKDRRANQVVKELIENHLVSSSSAYGSLRLKILSDSAAFLFPQLVS